MPDDSLQFYKEREALKALIDSEEFMMAWGEWRHPSLIPFMQEYLDNLCLHEWKEATPEFRDDDRYAIERCQKCKAERERTSE